MNCERTLNKIEQKQSGKKKETIYNILTAMKSTKTHVYFRIENETKTKLARIELRIYAPVLKALHWEGVNSCINRFNDE